MAAADQPPEPLAAHDILRVALHLPPQARDSYLEQACAGRPQLHAEVAELLHWHEHPATALANPTRASALTPTRAQPTQIGRYTVRGVLGEGGMGTVYEAEQEQPRRTVALKVMRRGLASTNLLRRFEFEAQVLGRLQHPGIAQVFEAGTTLDEHDRPVPFFAMELVRGHTLLRHAEQRALDRAARVELAARICEAVEHAHNKGVIHRDLKPGNILVDASGQPKVLDFGIARALDSESEPTTALTAAGQIVGTLEYMSPEQLSGAADDVDTRSDVFALGVILHELLTGRRPFDDGTTSLPDLLRRMRDDTRTRMSRLDRSLRGDLETIVDKALDRDRTRRYASADALASDLRRFLRDEPITARPASGWYHLVKFARRNTGLVIGLALAAVLLVLGLLGTSFGMYQAARARDAEATARRAAQDDERVAIAARADEAAARTKAERARDRATKVARFLSDTFLGVDREVALGRDTTLLASMMDRAAERMAGGELGDNPEAELVLRETIGNTYRRIGKFAAARSMLEPAVALARTTYADDAMEQAIRLNDLGILLQQTGELTAAEPMLVESLAIRRRSFPGDHDQVATGLQNLGILRFHAGAFAEARQLLEEAVAMRRRLEPNGSFDLAQTLAALGGALLGQHQAADALPVLRESHAMFQKVLTTDHPELVSLLSNLGHALRETGDTTAAAVALRESLAVARRLGGGDDPATVMALGQLAGLHEKAGEMAPALAAIQEAIAMAKRLYPEGERGTAMLLSNLARFLDRDGRPAEAEAALRESVTMSRRVAATEFVDYAANLELWSRRLQRRGESTDADALLSEALAVRRRVAPDDQALLARTIYDLGLLRRDHGDLDSATELLQDALALRRRLAPDGDIRVVEVLTSLGRLHARRGAAAAMQTCLDEAIQLSERLFGASHITTTRTRGALGDCVATMAWANRSDPNQRKAWAPRTREAVDFLRAGVAVAATGERGWHERIRLGQALLSLAAVADDAPPDARQAWLTEAEALLTRAHAASIASDGGKPEATPEQAARAAQWLTQLYELWEIVAPGQGKAAAAAQWRARAAPAGG